MRHLTKSILAATTIALGISPAFATDITGAGATFPFPIYAKWAEAYKAKTGVGMNYQSIGSGGGIAQIKAKTVDFGASDMPLKAEDLQSVGLVQFPAIIGGVVPVVNIEGVAPGAIRFTGPVLADIYLGKIKSWGDKAIADLNPGLKLPADPITVVRRSDGSGHDVPLDRLPVEGEPGMEGEGRVEHGRCVARRRRRQGQRRRFRLRPAHQGLDRLRRVRLREEEQDELRASAEPGRPVRAARRCDVPGRGGGRRLEERPRLRRDPDQPARQDELADHGRVASS